MRKGTTLLLLVRHGETEWNLSRRYQGQTEIELNEVGRKQAQLTAKRLANVIIHAAYSSDLQRAKATADIVAASHGLEVKALPQLRERNFGVMEGMTRAEAMQHSWWSDIEESDGLMSPPGGETRRQMRRRVIKCIDKIVADHQDQNVLIVTHGGPIAQLICDLLGAPSRRRATMRLDNCSLTIVRANPKDKALLLLNGIAHLHPEPPIGALAVIQEEVRE